MTQHRPAGQLVIRLKWHDPDPGPRLCPEAAPLYPPLCWAGTTKKPWGPPMDWALSQG